jgi:predicted nucleotidyltransferase
MDSPEVAQLAAELDSALGRVDGVRTIYLFGSAVESDTPRDVDVLIVYGPPLAPATAPTIGPLIEAAVSRAFSMPAHLMFFSEEEAREPGLVSQLEPLLLYRQPVTTR